MRLPCKGSIELVAGDFFASEETAKHVADADVVFVNNTAFGATVDNKLVRPYFPTSINSCLQMDSSRSHASAQNEIFIVIFLLSLLRCEIFSAR